MPGSRTCLHLAYWLRLDANTSSKPIFRPMPGSERSAFRGNIMVSANQLHENSLVIENDDFQAIKCGERWSRIPPRRFRSDLLSLTRSLNR